MTVRATIPAIAIAAGVLAACAGCTPLQSGAPIAASGATAPVLFSRDDPTSEVRIVPVADDTDTPLEKFSSGMSNMGHSIRRVFSRKQQQQSTNFHPKVGDDSISLAKPAQPRADFYVSLARIKERGGDLAGAAEHYKKALEIDPNDLSALMGIARLHDQQGELAEATKYYKQAAASHPKEAAVFNNQGLCLARQEKYGAAVESLRKAVELRPDRVLYRNNLASVQVEMDDVEAALATLSKTQGEAVAHYNVGFLLNQRGKTADALEQMKLAVAADDSLDAARQWINTLSTKLASEPPTTRLGKPGARVLVKQPGGFPSKPQERAVAVRSAEATASATDEQLAGASGRSGISNIAATDRAAEGSNLEVAMASAQSAVSKPIARLSADPRSKEAQRVSAGGTPPSLELPTSAAASTQIAAPERTEATDKVATTSPKHAGTASPTELAEAGSQKTVLRHDPVRSSAPRAAGAVAATQARGPSRLLLPPPPSDDQFTSGAMGFAPQGAGAQAMQRPAAAMATSQRQAEPLPPNVRSASPPALAVRPSDPTQISPRAAMPAVQVAAGHNKARGDSVVVKDPQVIPAQGVTRLPPTPDEIEEYSRRTSTLDFSKTIVPLPPLDPASYPPSRY